MSFPSLTAKRMASDETDWDVGAELGVSPLPRVSDGDDRESPASLVWQ